MSFSANNPMAPRSNNTPSSYSKTQRLSDGVIAAIAVTVSVGVVVALLSLYLWLYYRKKQRRASLEAIGAQNLYSTPTSARSSQIVVTRKVGYSVSRLPSTNSNSYGGRTPPRGSYRSDAPLLRGSYQSNTSPSRAVSGQAPPRPARPSWPASVLEANSNLEELVSTCAPLKRPVAVYSPTSPMSPCSCSSPFPQPQIAKLEQSRHESGGGQVVTTYRHPTPTLREQEGFMSARQRVEVERTLGASPGMTEVGFRREYYTMYDDEEDLRRESWRNISGGVVLSDEAKETLKWSKECNMEIGVAK